MLVFSNAKSSLPCLLLALACAACGGPAQPDAVPAAGLDYQDPGAAAGNSLASSTWSLVRNEKLSTGRRVVLDLVGPSDVKVRGVGFNLQAPPGVRFSPFAGSTSGGYAEEYGVFELRNLVPDVPGDPGEPVFFASGVKPGNLLTVGLFQKDRRATAKSVSKPVLRVALEIDPALSALLRGQPIPLWVTKARVIPEDIGQTGNDFEVAAKSHLKDVKVSVGTLRAQ
jgi:hypothetical protein